VRVSDSSPVSIQTQSHALRLDGNRAKRKRLRWQAANHGCHCFDRASYWLLLTHPIDKGKGKNSILNNIVQHSSQ